ncbi:T9SS type A sorting domain-containing protein [Candidatus Latescibacterota bacterium]
MLTSVLMQISSIIYAVEWESLGRTQHDNICNFYFLKSGTVFALTKPTLVYKSAGVLDVYALERYDGDGKWTTVNQTVLYPSVAITSDDAILMEVGSSVQRSNDEGMTWSIVSDSLHVSYIHTINVSPSGAIFLGANGNPPDYRSLDNGLTWNPIDIPYQAKFYYFVGDQIILAGLTTGIFPNPIGHLYRSEDGGDTWLKVKDFIPYTKNYHAATTSDGVIFLSATTSNGMGGNIYRSNDAGKNWQILESGLPEIDVSGISAYDETTVFISFIGGGIYRTTNGGELWTHISENLPHQNTGMPVTTMDGGVYFSVQEEGVFRSKDIGNSWENVLQQDTGIYSLKEGPNGSLYVGTLNGNVFRTKIEPNTIGSSQGSNVFFILKSPYPNPFNPATTIEYSLSQNSLITLSIYNISGQRVIVLKDEYQPVGNYTATWDAKGFPSGLYFCIMEANGFCQTKKMLLLK